MAGVRVELCELRIWYDKDQRMKKNLTLLLSNIIIHIFQVKLMRDFSV
jgi:hypothetical protein